MNASLAQDPAPATRFQLNETLDTRALHEAFRRRGNVLQIPSVLRESDAQALYAHLSQELQWGITFRGGTMPRRHIPPEECARLDAADARAMLEVAYADRGTNASHIFLGRYLPEDPQARLEDGSMFRHFADFLAGQEFIQLTRELTGDHRIRAVAVAATCYRPGHFYGFHADQRAGAEQVGAFVFNLTPHWLPQWGGLLQFRSSDGHVREAFCPRFNSLSLFVAPVEHAVSLVAPFAADARYSIAGGLLA